MSFLQIASLNIKCVFNRMARVRIIMQSRTISSSTSRRLHI